MNRIDNLAFDLFGLAPSFVSAKPDSGQATACYPNVPVTQLPPGTQVVPKDAGFSISGSVAGCRFSGQAMSGQSATHFDRVLVTIQLEPATVH
jgi:hypothetical protein